MEDYKLPNGLNEEKLCSQMNYEYDSVIDSVTTKRDMWR